MLAVTLGSMPPDKRHALDQVGELLAVAHGGHEGGSSGFRGSRRVAHQVRLERAIGAVWVLDAAPDRHDEDPEGEGEGGEKDHNVGVFCGASAESSVALQPEQVYKQQIGMCILTTVESYQVMPMATPKLRCACVSDARLVQYLPVSVSAVNWVPRSPIMNFSRFASRAATGAPVAC